MQPAFGWHCPWSYQHLESLFQISSISKELIEFHHPTCVVVQNSFLCKGPSLQRNTKWFDKKLEEEKNCQRSFCTQNIPYIMLYWVLWVVDYNWEFSNISEEFCSTVYPFKFRLEYVWQHPFWYFHKFRHYSVFQYNVANLWICKSVFLSESNLICIQISQSGLPTAELRVFSLQIFWAPK